MPASAQSQAVIRGQLIAEADGSAVSGGTVTLKSGATGATTQTAADAGGRFSIQNVTPGDYMLTAVAAGFSPRDEQLVVEPREVRTVTLALAVQGVSVTVSVTGALPALPRTHSPSSTVLTAGRIEDLPAAQRTGLTDALVTVAPGMIRGHDDFVHIRGEEVALNPLIDGVAFWENAHAVFSAGLSPDVIDTAKVMTGGFPAEYGNRFGGVVDIVTRSGFQMSNDGSLTLNGGQAGRRSAAGDFGGHGSRVGYYVFGTMFGSDRFLSPPSPQAVHDHGQGGHGLFQADATLGRAGTLRLLFMGDAANFDVPKTIEDVVLRPDASATQRTRQQTAIVGWTRAWSSRTLGATFYQRWSRSELLPAQGPLTARAAVDRQLLTIGAKLDATHVAGRHVVKAGVDAVRLTPDENLSYDYSGFSTLAHELDLPLIHLPAGPIAFSERTGGGQISAYAQDDIAMGERVTADVGVRVDRFDLLEVSTLVSPRANIAVRVGSGAVVHASYNRFFAPPPVEGILSSAAGLTAQIAEIAEALPPVQPTTEHQLELGVSAPAGPLQLGLTGYYRASRNPVHTTVWPDSRVYSYASFHRGRAYGLEAKLDVPGLARYGVTGYLNYALGRVYYYNPATGGFVTEDEHVSESNRFLAPMDQTHTLTAGVAYHDARTGLFAGTAVEYGSGTPREAGQDEPSAAAPASPVTLASSARVPGHVTADLSFGVDLLRRSDRRGRFSLRADVQNVGDNVYLIAQESEFSPQQFFVPRLFSLTAKLRF